MKGAFRSFPEVLIVDATYRTNKLRVPLFVFIMAMVAAKSSLMHL